MKTISKIIGTILALCLLITPSVALAQNDNNSVYNEDKDKYYNTLAEAFVEAESDEVLYVVKDYDLDASISVPNGVTLIIPTSDDLNDFTSQSSVITGSPVSGSAHVTLTISNNAVLTVPSDATLLVAGKQQSTQPQSGYLTGDYGKITIESGSQLVINGTIFARGVIDGAGILTASSGAEVYQLFQIADWRGGTGSGNAYNDNVFPFNLYEVNNIRCPAQYNMGASMRGQYYIVVSGSFFGYTFNIPVSGSVNIIGSNALLNCTSGTINTSYVSNTLIATVNGTVQTGNLSLSIMGDTYNSAALVLPFGYKMNVVIPNGCTLTINNKIKLLPNCNITNLGNLSIASGAALYLYKYGNYSTAYNFADWNGTSNAQVTGSGTITMNGIFAESDANGSLFVKEYIQSTNATVNVPFAPISIP